MSPTRDFPTQGVAEFSSFNGNENEVLQTGEVEAGGFDHLAGGREVDKTVLPVDGGPGKPAGPFGFTPLGPGANLEKQVHADGTIQSKCGLDN